MRSRASDGVLLVDKPAGVTSHDVVLAARRALGERRVGHTGTLDPFATGLLVLLVGSATRLLPYVDGEPKVYEATVAFGAETETDDVTGPTTRVAPPPEPDAVLRAMEGLTGEIAQLPPAYSAKRVGGRRAYELARAGAAVRLEPVRVRVHGWEVRGWRGNELDVAVTCGGGTYVRALARDLGRLAASAAHLSALRRVRSGPFHVSRACTFEDLRSGAAGLLPSLDALSAFPVEALDEAAVARIAHGLDVEAITEGERAALVDAQGALVALAERRGARWQPRVVMHRA